MKLKEFIKNFSFNKPDWGELPEGFPECDLAGLSSEEIGRFMAIKNLWELSQPEKPKARSRVWESTNGYIYLVAWSNASLLRILATKWFGWFKGNYRNLEEFRGGYRIGPKLLDRLEGQLLDSLRSVVANIEEGFARATTGQYLDFLGYSQGSLKEAKGDFQRARQDGFLKSVPGTSLSGLGIDLRDWHEALKKSVISSSKILQNPPESSKGNYRNLEEVRGEPFRFGYPPVDNLDPRNLTYEILIELINKTDWHLRRLVESLEKKEGYPPSLKLRRTR
ncbi:MAG: four helix bundle protein [Patescibacteria group bacterium]